MHGNIKYGTGIAWSKVLESFVKLMCPRIPSQDALLTTHGNIKYGNVYVCVRLQDRLAGMEEEARQHREQVEREEAALDRTITSLRAQLLQVRTSYFI